MPMSQSGKGLIERAEQLAQYLCDGCKPKSNWLIGAEHEKFGFRHSDHWLLLYDGRCSIKTILEGLRDRFGWESAQKKSRRRPDHNQSFSNDQTIIWMLGSLDKGGNWNFSGISDREWRDSILPKLRAFESMTWAIQADGFQNA